MGNIRGVQFPNQKLTAADHRTVIAKALTDGKLNGCNLTYSGNTLTIGTGAFLISGGQVSITSAETAQFTQTSGYGRLIAEIDISGTATRLSWDQFTWRVDYAATADGFTELTQENINTGNGTIYQIEFAVVSLSNSGITGIVRQLDNAEGGGNVYAFIVATYPAGSVCTCTNGTKTLRAKNTSGSWVFNIPSAGTWTVSCTDGTKTKSKVVNISSQGQSENVSLNYSFVLFEAGSGALVEFFTANQSQTATRITIDTSNILIERLQTAYAGCFIRTTNALNLENYATLNVICNITSYESGWQHSIGISSNAPTITSDFPFTFTAEHAISSTGQQTISIDVSSLSTGYFALGEFVYGSITKIELV